MEINVIGTCRYGKMLFNKYDVYIGRSLSLYGEYAFFEMDLFSRIIKEGDVVLDVGANIGTHTLFFAKLVGNTGGVFSFEPQRCIFQMLCANVAINSIFNVFCFQNAVTETPTLLTVPGVNYTAEGNFGGLSLSKEGFGEKVMGIPIDSLSLSKCNFIKIDVEGMESEVLKGATNTIKKYRPILYVENDRTQKSEKLIELILSMDYKIWVHLAPLYNPNNFMKNEENVFGTIVAINMLCIHKKIPTKIDGLSEITDPEGFWKASGLSKDLES